MIIKAGHFPAVIRSIQAGEDWGMCELYSIFKHPHMRSWMALQLNCQQELEDRLHEGFVITIEAIKKDAIRNPEALLGFIYRILYRQSLLYVTRSINDRRTSVVPMDLIIDDRNSFSKENAEREDRKLIGRSLSGIRPQDREILRRFYLQEQPMADICRDMHLTTKQFTLHKWRALERFGKKGRALLGMDLSKFVSPDGPIRANPSMDLSATPRKEYVV